MRKQIAAANWKMNKTSSEAVLLVNEILKLLQEKPLKKEAHHVVIAPPFTGLTKVAEIIKSCPFISLAAQNCHPKPSGAYTGEVSVEMLKDAACSYVIIGHSERRAYFNEDDNFLFEKVQAVLQNGLKPIFCCGEVLNERNAGLQNDIVFKQLKNTLFRLPESNFCDVLIAYEPVWAIGTGVTATPEQAQEMHGFIRKLISQQYHNDVAMNTSILYGGSCNAKNATELFSKPDVDGGLIGGASLNAQDFVSIIQSLS